MPNLKSLSIATSAVCALSLGIASLPAHAGVLNFSFLPSGTFSGTAPAGSLTADFTDVTQSKCGASTSGGCVELVITSSLASGENIDPGAALFLNFDPAETGHLAPGVLTFALTANTGFSQPAAVTTGEDAFKADGDGLYDIMFNYTSSTKAFTTGQLQTYDISTSVGMVAADDFNFLSTPSGGQGTFLAAIHVQNTPSGGSGSAWVGACIPGTPGCSSGPPLVTEPGSLGLFVVALAALGLIWYHKSV